MQSGEQAGRQTAAEVTRCECGCDASRQGRQPGTRGRAERAGKDAGATRRESKGIDGEARMVSRKA